MSKKISEMLGTTTIPADASFTLISEGANFKISQTNLIAQIGENYVIQVKDSDGNNHNVPVTVV